MPGRTIQGVFPPKTVLPPDEILPGRRHRHEQVCACRSRGDADGPLGPLDKIRDRRHLTGLFRVHVLDEVRTCQKIFGAGVIGHRLDRHHISDGKGSVESDCCGIVIAVSETGRHGERGCFDVVYIDQKAFVREQPKIKIKGPRRCRGHSDHLGAGR